MNSILAVVFSIVVDLLQIEAVQTGLIVLVSHRWLVNQALELGAAHRELGHPSL